MITEFLDCQRHSFDSQLYLLYLSLLDLRLKAKIILFFLIYSCGPRKSDFGIYSAETMKEIMKMSDITLLLR